MIPVMRQIQTAGRSDKRRQVQRYGKENDKGQDARRILQKGRRRPGHDGFDLMEHGGLRLRLLLICSHFGAAK